MINISINNELFRVPEGTTVAVAIMTSYGGQFRRSVSGEPRGPLCGMGICFECRVIINGVKHQKSCTILVEERMEVVTDE